MRTKFTKDVEGSKMTVTIKGIQGNRSFKAGGGLESVNWHIETPTAKVYQPVSYADRDYVLTLFRRQTSTGSGTLTVAVDGTPVGDLTAIAATDTETDTAVDPVVSVPLGSVVTVEVTDAGDMADLTFALVFR